MCFSKYGHSQIFFIILCLTLFPMFEIIKSVCVCVCQFFKVRLVSLGVVLIFLILLVFGITSLTNFLAHWKETVIRIEDHTSKFMSSFGCSSETLSPSSWEPKGVFFIFRCCTSALLLLDCRGVKFSLWKQSSLFISVTYT